MPKNSLIIIFLLIPFLVLFTLITVRVISGRNEDTWICVDGKWEQHGNPDTPKPLTGCGNNNAKEEWDPLRDGRPVGRPDFRNSGNVTNFDSSSETLTDEWYFVYESPGNPANRVRLIFDERSRCRLRDYSGGCDVSMFENGGSARIIGSRIEEGVDVDTVLVITLTLQTTLQSEDER